MTDVPSRYSLQIGDGIHLDLPSGYDQETIMDSYFWRFMNHSCEPNATVEGRQVKAVRDIGPGDEITFHYNTTELDMSEPFDCECGSALCEGRIAGFAHTTREARARIRPWLAPHLAGRVPAAEGGKGTA
ncbi:SET domain-containing protein-lysine N-methyltransferase [Streptomyces nanshensis]|uniref:SET domain-containing protein-lysine N-methyltransferase n=1 Tax=Streptomyces nanshensis TaxID=518642 RepID=UPI001495B7FC|nr:SET domain-containing protein-lysine N-methyltransferase [Streptomyces nanshensis]